MTNFLDSFGFGEFFAAQMSGLSDDLFPARVVGQHRREWDIVTAEGATRALLAGRRWSPGKHEDVAATQPTVGDFVAVRGGSGGELPVIEHILERRTWLSRTSLAKRGARQTLVANVDVVAVVAAFAHPDSSDFAAKRSLQPRRIERYLTAIEKGGATPLVVLNKSDLDPRAEQTREALADRLGTCPVITLSCLVNPGLEPLLERTQKGQTIGLVGLSGVGKSSIVNRLLGHAAQKVSSERTSDARGRHTTTHRELFRTDSGLIVIDTPGMREFALVGGDEADLGAFSDIAELAKRCQFRDCSHGDEPGCSVARAVERRELEADRLRSFRLLADELKRADQARQRRKPDRGKRRQSTSKRRRNDWDDEK